MPIINEVKSRLVGKDFIRHIWIVCPKCGKERWVQIYLTRRPGYTGICLPCTNRKRGFGDIIPDEYRKTPPKVNGTEIRFRAGRRVKCIFVECSECGKQRWIRFAQTQSPDYTSFCSSCAGKRYKPGRHKLGPEHASWKGGRNKNGGYILVWLAKDDFFYPMAKKNGYVLEHRLVMAKHLGRCLHSWEFVHHKNHIRDDNQIENLQLVTDSRHNQITILENRIAFLEKEVERLKNNH